MIEYAQTARVRLRELQAKMVKDGTVFVPSKDTTAESTAKRRGNAAIDAGDIAKLLLEEQEDGEEEGEEGEEGSDDDEDLIA